MKLLFLFFLLTQHILGLKYITFTCIFSKKNKLLFDRPFFFFIFILPARPQKLQNIFVNQLIKICWPGFSSIEIREAILSKQWKKACKSYDPWNIIFSSKQTTSRNMYKVLSSDRITRLTYEVQIKLFQI